MITMNQDFNVYASKLVSRDEKFTAGHRGCVGCGEALAVRQVMKALSEEIGKNFIVVNATGCIEIISSAYPATCWEIPWIHTLFENNSAVGSGIEVAYKALKRKGKYPKDRNIKVVCIGGDGSTADIGFQALSGALERGHDFMYVCFDNEAYMNTGIQRSGATPYGATTTTSPAGEKTIGQVTWKKNMPAIVAAHGIPYVATASPAYPFDLFAKVKKALAIKGPSYLHVFSPCPTGWRSAPDLSVRYARQIVQAGVFPLYEVENGRKWNLTIDPGKLIPITDYFKGQGRFRHLKEEDLKYIQDRVTREYEELKKRCE